MKMKTMTEKVRQGKRITTGDKVYVIAGNERGQIGKVLSHLGEKVIVQGLNMRKRHTKKSREREKGAIIEREAPIHVSNVKLCIADDKAHTVKAKNDSKGERQLYYNDGAKEVVYRPLKKRKMQ